MRRMGRPLRHNRTPRPSTSMPLRANSHRNGPPHRQLARLPFPRKTRRQEPLSRPPGQLYLPLLCPSDRKIRWPRTGVQVSPRRQIFLQPLLNPVQNRQTLLHHLTWLTLTRLAVLGCFKQQTFLLRQLALSVVTTHGQLRTSFFALMVLSRLL